MKNQQDMIQKRNLSVREVNDGILYKVWTGERKPTKWSYHLWGPINTPQPKRGKSQGHYQNSEKIV